MAVARDTPSPWNWKNTPTLSSKTAPALVQLGSGGGDDPDQRLLCARSSADPDRPRALRFRRCARPSPRNKRVQRLRSEKRPARRRSGCGALPNAAAVETRLARAASGRTKREAKKDHEKASDSRDSLLRIPQRAAALCTGMGNRLRQGSLRGVRFAPSRPAHNA